MDSNFPWVARAGALSLNSKLVDIRCRQSSYRVGAVLARGGVGDPHKRSSPSLSDQVFALASGKTYQEIAAAARFARDSLLEGDGFELPVPEREDRVSSLGLLLARDRGNWSP